MKVNKISHIGIAVPNIEEQLAFFKDFLTLEYLGEERVEDQQVKVAFFKVGDSRVELLEPTSPQSPIQKFLDNREGKPAMHHVAYEVSDLDQALLLAKEKGYRLIDETPRLGARGTRIAFLHPKGTAGVLTELCEQHGAMGSK